MNEMLQTLSRRIGAFPIELPAAAMLAGAVALSTLALPDWRFEGAVAATGLPALVSAAQPPLGWTARLLVAAILAALAFAATWTGLRALDRKPEPGDFPSFRAADLHPDAPRRRPILAGAEFGAPADDLPPIETQLARKRPPIAETLPSFLAPQPPEIAEFVPETIEPEPAPVVEPVPVAERAPAVDPEPTFVSESTPLAEPTPASEPAPVAERESIFDVRPAPAPADPFLSSEVAPKLPSFMSFEGFDEEEPPANSAVKRVAREPEELSQLMARLEGGIARRGGKPVAGPAGPAREELSRALDDLDRTAARRR